MPRRWKLLRRPEPRTESWLSSAAPKRGRMSTPGTLSRTSFKLAARDSSIAFFGTISTPPGVRSISSRACSSVRVRSGGSTPDSTTTGSSFGGAGGATWAEAAATARIVAANTETRTRTGMSAISLCEVRALISAETRREAGPTWRPDHCLAARARSASGGRLDGRLVEIGVAGRFLNDDFADAAVDQDVDLQQSGALDAEAPSGGGIGRPDLIAALRPRQPGDGAGRSAARRRRERRGRRRRGRRGAAG